MQSNIGTLDKSIRIVLILTALSIYQIEIVEGSSNYVFLIISGILVVTVVLNYCPLYTFWGFSSKEK
jgi:hypothetical protein